MIVSFTSFLCIVASTACILQITSAQTTCPRLPSLPQIVGVLTSGGTGGHPAKINIHLRHDVTLVLNWYKSVEVLQGYNHTAYYQVPISADDRGFTITTRKSGNSYHTSLDLKQSETLQDVDFSKYHLTIDVNDECFQYTLTITAPVDGGDGKDIVMPTLQQVQKKIKPKTEHRNDELSLRVLPYIPQQVMQAIQSGRIQEHDDLFNIHISPWQRLFSQNGTDVQWSGLNQVPEDIRQTLMYGGYPTASYMSTRSMRVTPPGLYVATYTQLFEGMRLEFSVTTEVVPRDTERFDGSPPAVGVATCGVYTWRNSTFGDVVTLRRGEPNCMMCVAYDAMAARLTMAKQIFRSGEPVGYRRVRKDGRKQIGKMFSSVRHVFQRSTPDDAGWYVCGATNDFGTTMKTFRIEVIEPVEILSVEPKTIAIMGDGQVVSFKCSAQGSPNLNFTFYRMDLSIYQRFQEDPITSLEYRAFPLVRNFGSPPPSNVTISREGSVLTAELKHRIARMRYYSQRKKFACVAHNSYGDFRVGVANIFWAPRSFVRREENREAEFIL